MNTREFRLLLNKIKELAAKENVKPYILKNNYIITRDLDKALELAVQNVKLNIKYQGKEYCFSRLCKKYHIDNATLQMALLSGKTIDDVINKHDISNDRKVYTKRDRYNIEYNGEVYNLSQLAEKFEISRTNLVNYLNEYSDIYMAVKKAKEKTRCRYLIDLGAGKKEYYLTHIANVLNISYDKLKQAIESGMNIDDAVKKVVNDQHGVVYYDFGNGLEKTTINKIAIYYHIDRDSLQKKYDQCNNISLAVNRALAKSKPRTGIYFFNGQEEYYNSVKDFTDKYNLPYQSFKKYYNDSYDVNLVLDFMLNKDLNFGVTYDMLKKFYTIKKASNQDRMELVKKYNLSYLDIIKVLSLDLNYNNGVLITNKDPNYIRRVLLKKLCLAYNDINVEDFVKVYNLTYKEICYINRVVNKADEIYSGLKKGVTKVK